MFNIVFYENKKGESQLLNELNEMMKKSISDKTSRIQSTKITFYIEQLKYFGTRLPNNVSKHIVDNIWELRPLDNRILYFFYKDNTFVLLHMFKKKTKKTPRSEIEKAIRERDDFINRKGEK